MQHQDPTCGRWGHAMDSLHHCQNDHEPLRPISSQLPRRSEGGFTRGSCRLRTTAALGFGGGPSIGAKVNVEARGQGIGSALVRALLERRKTEQKRRVYALTLKNKLGFFERLQFQEVSGDDLPEDLSLEVSLGRLIAPLAAGEPLIALLKHLERLEGLAEELHAHQPYLRAAKDAFSAPKAEDAKISGLPSSPHSVRHPADEKESPVVILQPRKDRSLFGSGLGRVPKEYMIKFLESAIDFVGAAATATGMSADVPTPPEEATAKATAKAMAAAKNAERLDGVAGRISSWLDVEVSDLVVWDPDPVDWTSSQNLWQRCRKTDRRWTLA
ncbi:N-acetyltransferase domain-containing protein [Durusdinium trenchii]|uniref:N-acetyltransferase domain-containing protein n=1 Tax=Durusdinium trenchii TaxID=1381693 RepID=A0ABP0II10_9DINO